MKTRTGLRLAAPALIVLGLAGCVGVHVQRGVRNADAYFARAERDIARLERHRGAEHVRVHRLHILAHDRRQGELIRLTVPLWMVRLAMDIGREAERHHHDFDIEERYDVDWRALRGITRFGPGLLAAVDGIHDRVLIWLE